jgi:hypothetical protein
MDAKPAAGLQSRLEQLLQHLFQPRLVVSYADTFIVSSVDIKQPWHKTTNSGADGWLESHLFLLPRYNYEANRVWHFAIDN